MKISARNVLKGQITGVTSGVVNAEVTLQLASGESIVSVITNSSVAALELAPGKPAFAIIKASEVIIGKGLDASRISARNVISGQISGLINGVVSSEITIHLGDGSPLVAAITKQSVEALGLAEGDEVSAIIKASSVMIGV
jgi:molybdate transport system regulatory protein